MTHFSHDLSRIPKNDVTAKAQPQGQLSNVYNNYAENGNTKFKKFSSKESSENSYHFIPKHAFPKILLP